MTDATDTTDVPAVTHASFTVERIYPQSPDKVFFALSDKDSVRRWRVEGEGFEVFEHSMDFRIGGREFSRFRYGTGPEMYCDTQYHDIIGNRRIVYAYRMGFGEKPISASLNTIELEAVPGGTRLTLVEQGAYFEQDCGVAGREAGTRELLESLARDLDRTAA